MTIPDVIARLETFAAPIGAATVRGAIILLVALIATQLLRRHSAATRHAIWSGAIAAQLVVLALGTWGPHWRIATPPAVADAVAPVMAIPADRGIQTPQRARADVPSFDVGVQRGRNGPASSGDGSREHAGNWRGVSARSRAEPQRARVAAAHLAWRRALRRAAPCRRHGDGRHARPPRCARRRRTLAVARAEARQHPRHRPPAHPDARRRRGRPHHLGDRLSRRAAAAGCRCMDRGAAALRARARDGACEAARRAHAAHRADRPRPVLVQSVGLDREPAHAAGARARVRRLRAASRDGTVAVRGRAPRDGAVAGHARPRERAARIRGARHGTPQASSRDACFPSSIPFWIATHSAEEVP